MPIEQWTEFSRFFIALIAVLDPFAAVPVFISLTAHYSAGERHQVARVAAVSVAVVLILAALGGDRLLILMGASIGSFRVGGGIVLLLMSLEMLRAQPSQIQQTPEELNVAGSKSAIAVVPIAIPLLAGPGAISAVVIQAHRGDDLLYLSGIIATILVVAIILWITLRLAVPIGNHLGPLGIKITNRLLGLMLAAIAIEIMGNGLRELFPVLAG